MSRIAAFAVIVMIGFLLPLFSVGATDPTKILHVGIVWIGDGPGPNTVAFDHRLAEFGYAEERASPAPP